jgi:hypothetical protein
MNKKQMKRIRKVMAGEDRSMIKLAKKIYKLTGVLPLKKGDRHVTR